MNAKPLNEKEELFCQLVAQGKAYVDAYGEAFPAAKPRKRITEYVKSSELAKKFAVRIKELQESHQQVVTSRFRVDAESWARQITRIAFADPRQLFDPETGVPIAPHKLGDDIAGAIEGVEVGKDGVKYKFARKNPALDAIAKRLQLWNEVPMAQVPTETAAPIDTMRVARIVAVMLANATKLNGVEVVDVVPKEKMNGGGK